MNIYSKDIEAIIKTLPVGYYAFSRIPIVCDHEHDSSYFNPINMTINISCKAIAQALASVDETTISKETATRSMLYHEVSHALLTPMGIAPITDVINIMEDERIETVMANYFMGVDFKKLVAVYNGWKGYRDTPYENPISMFFDIVRFHYCSDRSLVLEAESIVKDFERLDGASDDWECKRYVRRINDLYEKVKKLFASNPNPPVTPNPEAMEGQDGNGAGASGAGQQGDIKADNDGNASGNASGDGENGNEDGNGKSATGKADSEHGKGGHTKGGISADRARELLRKAVSHLTSNGICVEEDEKMTANFERIIASFNKRNNSGSASASYSGVLNPRNCKREDYRFFDKKSEVNGANKYGTVHLNFFIDVSGSMCHNQTALNQILKSIYLVDRKFKNFSYNIVACGTHHEVLDNVSHSYVICDGGNNIEDSIWETYRKLQKPNTFNYNIALFDGDAFSDGSRREHKNFGVFNHPNCVIITDPENEEYLEFTPNARKIVTKRYLAEFKSLVIKMLTNCFR